MKEFDELIEVMHRLRVECPWDREQDLSSLRKYLMEEAYECLESLNLYIQQKSPESYRHLKEELGDLLLQILFQAQLLREQTNQNSLQELCRELKEKLVRRHPHVFGVSKQLSAEAVHQQWNEIKAREKARPETLMGDIPKSMSALLRAQKIGSRTHKLKFDWKNPQEVAAVVESEWEELKQAKTSTNFEEEFGDLLFSLVQWARHSSLDAETTLAKANQKFEKRFLEMEKICIEKKLRFEDLSLEEKEDLWAQAKIRCK